MQRYAKPKQRRKQISKKRYESQTDDNSTISTDVDNILHLQRTIGNQAVIQMMREDKLQRWVSATPTGLQHDEEESTSDTESDNNTDSNEGFFLDPNFFLGLDASEQEANSNEADSDSEPGSNEGLYLDPSEFENMDGTDNDADTQAPSLSPFERTQLTLDYQLGLIDKVEGLYGDFVSAISGQDYPAASGIFSEMIGDGFGMFVDPNFEAYGGAIHSSEADSYHAKRNEINERSADLRQQIAKIVSKNKKYLEADVVNEYKEKQQSFKQKAKDRKRASKEVKKNSRSLRKALDKEVGNNPAQDKRDKKKRQKIREQSNALRQRYGLPPVENGY